LFREAAPAFNQLNDFVGGNKVQLSRQGRLQVGLQELAVPG
jgi:hypothetical protein